MTATAATWNLPCSMDAKKGMDARYDEDYFLHGRKSGKSLYDNYRWLPNLTIPMATVIVDHCRIQRHERILDFGCARGYVVKALAILGHNAVGVDVSKWALENADPSVKDQVSSEWPPTQPVDWIIAKDVLEHVPLHSIGQILLQFADVARRGVFIVVPLAGGLGQPYVVEDYEKDVTHVLRWPLDTWVDEILNAFDHTWEISCRYRIRGIKDNYADWERGNGFITCRKI